MGQKKRPKERCYDCDKDVDKCNCGAVDEEVEECPECDEDLKDCKCPGINQHGYGRQRGLDEFLPKVCNHCHQEICYCANDDEAAPGGLYPNQEQHQALLGEEPGHLEDKMQEDVKAAQNHSQDMSSKPVSEDEYDFVFVSIDSNQWSIPMSGRARNNLIKYFDQIVATSQRVDKLYFEQV